MPDLQWIKLENFIPRDVLEHTRLLRRNFVRINEFVQGSATGAVPNYYYNVLSQQYMCLSEKLLAEPTDAELEGLDVRAKVLVAARFGVNDDLDMELKEDLELELEEQVKLSCIAAMFALNEDKAAESANPQHIASPPQELEVSSMPQDIELVTEQDESIRIVLPSTLLGVPSTFNLGTAHRPKSIKAFEKPQDIKLSTEQRAEIRVRLPPSTHGLASTSQLDSIHKSKNETPFIMPQDVDLNTDHDKEIYVKLPPESLGVGSMNDLQAENIKISEMVMGSDSSSSRSVPKTVKRGYKVEMQNVKPSAMFIGNSAEKRKVLRKLFYQNTPRIPCIQHLKDLTYIGWINPGSTRKLVSAMIVEFSTVQQANEAIKMGLAYGEIVIGCRKYAHDCKRAQCGRCQTYGHLETQCTSLPRCRICSGRHYAAQCSSTVELCALCGGGHCADYSSCPRLKAEKSWISQVLRKPQFGLWPTDNIRIEADSRADSMSTIDAATLPQPDRSTQRETLREVLSRAPPQMNFEQFLSQMEAVETAQKDGSKAASVALRGGSETQIKPGRVTKRVDTRALKDDSYPTRTMAVKESVQLTNGHLPKTGNIFDSARVGGTGAKALKDDTHPARTMRTKQFPPSGNVSEAHTRSGTDTRKRSETSIGEKYQENHHTLAKPSSPEKPISAVAVKAWDATKPSSSPDKPTPAVTVNAWDASAADEEGHW